MTTQSIAGSSSAPVTRVKLRRGWRFPTLRPVDVSAVHRPSIDRVAIRAADYPQLRATLSVTEQQIVHAGQTLFADRRHPELRFVAPLGGRVSEINLGPRRQLESIVIEHEQRVVHETQELDRHRPRSSTRDEARRWLTATGLWTGLRSRPHSRVPLPTSEPQALLVTAIDTHPHALDPDFMIGHFEAEFRAGLQILRHATNAKIFVCVGPAFSTELPGLADLTTVVFDGPHPAGLPGTHIHRLAIPAAASESWYIGYQDVIAIGRQLATGQSSQERWIAVSASAGRGAQICAVPIGADIEQLPGAAPQPGETVFSGTPLAGRRVASGGAFLGRYDLQVTVAPAVAALPPPNTPARFGMLNVEAFETVWPLQVPVQAVLRALLGRDQRLAELLGCLALDAEDMALCTLVCPARLDYGAELRALLGTLDEAA